MTYGVQDAHHLGGQILFKRGEGEVWFLGGQPAPCNIDTAVLVLIFLLREVRLIVA